jgi:hypothetical protein
MYLNVFLQNANKLGNILKKSVHRKNYNVEADPTEIVVCVVTYCWLPWNEIDKPLRSNGHLPNITHVGGSHIVINYRGAYNLTR